MTARGGIVHWVRDNARPTLVADIIRIRASEVVKVKSMAAQETSSTST